MNNRKTNEWYKRTQQMTENKDNLQYLLRLGMTEFERLNKEVMIISILGYQVKFTPYTISINSDPKTTILYYHGHSSSILNDLKETGIPKAYHFDKKIGDLILFYHNIIDGRIKNKIPRNNTKPLPQQIMDLVGLAEFSFGTDDINQTEVKRITTEKSKLFIATNNIYFDFENKKYSISQNPKTETMVVALKGYKLVRLLSESVETKKELTNKLIEYGIC